MLIPESFLFTQQNLQDFVDCKRRFYLKEIQHLEWPAIESAPVLEQERLLLLGERFHLLCLQYFSGIPVEVLEEQIEDPELIPWWQNFLHLELDQPDTTLSAEKMIVIPLDHSKLAAKFDLIVNHEEQEYRIYDWKTSQHQPKRVTLHQRMQTKVYLLVLYNYISSKNPGFQPESIEMSYWYPNFPDSPVTFSYSQTQLENDRQEIISMINEIRNLDEKDFVKTDQLSTCKYCRFRSLCDRGVQAGISEDPISEQDALDPFDIAFSAL
jgi:CRISPR/Cas system-associated exonuclease Cas4 (RecB family)